MKYVHKKVTIDVEYTVGIQDPVNGVFQGGVPDPDYVEEELYFDLSPDIGFNETADAVVATGKTQINLRGSPRAYFAFAQYLLALTELETQDPDYHDHFESVRDSNGQASVHLIVHAPKQKSAF